MLSAGSVQSVAIDVAYSVLAALLFGVTAWLRPNDRNQAWFAGWFYALVGYLARLAQCNAEAGNCSLAAASVDAFVFTGAFFVVSAITLRTGRRFAITLWCAIALPTAICLTLVTFGVQSPWVLVPALLFRQAPLFFMQWDIRRERPWFAATLFLIDFTVGASLLAAILRGHPGIMVPMLLGEIFCIAGLDICNKGIERTTGMYVSSVGLMAWGLTFPLSYFVQVHWPAITPFSDLWNPPKACVVVGMILIVVSDEIRAAGALGRDYRLVFDGNPHPLWIVDLETLRILSVNDAACADHGYTKEEFLQLTLPDILHPDARQAAVREARRPIPASNRASLHVRKDGSVFPVDIVAHNVEFQGRRCRLVLGLDVTRRENLARRLEFQSNHDPLTGLANRRLFEQQLTDAVAQTLDSGQKLALVCFDISHFKRLKGVYGPEVCDQCIQHVAGVLNALMRPTDFVARTSDDEFAMVLTQLRDAAPVEKLSAYLYESFKAPVMIRGFEIQLCFNLGVAVCPDDGADAMALWHLAENALRRARANGSGHAVWLSPELRADAEKRKEIAVSLGRMLEDDSFRLVYQPLFALDGSVCSMEVLLRFNHPRYGAISPLMVVQIAEETGLIEPLATWVLNRTCRQIQDWSAQGMRTVPVAINVSLLQLMRKGFGERLMQTFKRFAIDPRWIHLEVTETAAMTNVQEVSREMASLAALGCTFSIDDFGTGYSSLARLHELPVSIVKIDRSFVEHLCDRDDPRSSFAIVQAILSMAHSLGLKVVAEGVETEAQLACLRLLGCDYYQGFLLAKPIPAECLPELLSAMHPAFAPALVRRDCAVFREQPTEHYA